MLVVALGNAFVQLYKPHLSPWQPCAEWSWITHWVMGGRGGGGGTSDSQDP